MRSTLDSREVSATRVAGDVVISRCSGGGDSADGRLSSVERYDPALNAWETVAPMGAGRIGGIALV